LIDTDEPVLVINTGNGLKDVRAAMQAVGEVVVIEPTIQAVRRVIK
jgi:threonine synthase